MNLQIFSQWRPVALVLGVLAGMTLPASANPLATAPDRGTILPAASSANTDVKPVNYRNRRSCGRNGNCGRGWNNNYRRHYRQPRYYGQRRYYGRHNDWRYNRWVYPRYYRAPIYPGYRYVEPRRHYGQGSAHVAWCYNRYRSYRAWDNTFQPYHGPRRQCHSPYWR